MTYVFLADGFEEIEALTTVDILRRSGLQVTMVGVGGEQITGAHGIRVQCDIIQERVIPSTAEMVVIPGGMPGVSNLAKSSVLKEFINLTILGGGYVAAICAGPAILGEMGVLQGKNAICFPGFENSLKGARISDEPLVHDGQFITAKGPGMSMEFALYLAQLLCKQHGGSCWENFPEMKEGLQCRK